MVTLTTTLGILAGLALTALCACSSGDAIDVGIEPESGWLTVCLPTHGAPASLAETLEFDLLEPGTGRQYHA